MKRKLIKFLLIFIFLPVLFFNFFQQTIYAEQETQHFFDLKAATIKKSENIYDVTLTWNESNFTEQGGKFTISIHRVNDSAPIHPPPDGQPDGGIVAGGEEKILEYNALETTFTNVDFSDADFGQFALLTYIPKPGSNARSHKQRLFFILDNTPMYKSCTLVGSFSTKEIEKYPEGYENPIHSLAVNKNYVYLSDTAHHQIVRYSLDGSKVKRWGSLGNKHGQFKYPKGIAVDSTGKVYVADTFNGRIEIFDHDGQYLKTISSLRSPQGIAIDNQDNLYVTETGNIAVKKYNLSGEYITQWKSPITQPNLFSITVGLNGEVYVGDVNNDRIYKFDNSLRPQTAFGHPVGFSQYNDNVGHPVSLTTDKDGLLYTGVIDKVAKMFTPNGRYSGTLLFKSMAVGYNKYDDLIYTYTGQSFSYPGDKIEKYSCLKTDSRVLYPDANLDGMVDGIDYAFWLRYYGYHMLGQRYGDFNEDNQTDGADYVIWLAQTNNQTN
ncbi:SMP-30/gluconolactonase/LRE family protein [Candidatus Microgenomates bacterium]|nr:SMP-30/gluconolactonase/LRE family protein [Candidatus Microgenomates bacterium]